MHQGNASSRDPGRRPGRRFRRRVSTLAAAGLVGAMVLGACGGGGSSGSGGGGGGGGAGASASKGNPHATTVTWWYMYTGLYANYMKEMAAKFNATHPGIHVDPVSIPGSSADQKLLSTIAAGDPPDLFLEWNAVYGEDAASHAVIPENQYLTGKYAGLEKWLYPSALKGGLYHKELVGIPMSLNTWELFYNKTIMKQTGVTKPPKTLAQLNADQAKAWKINGNRIQQMGFYPNSWEFMTSYFGVKDFTGGKYRLASDPHAIAEMKYLASYNKYPYSAVTAFSASLPTNFDAFSMGKEEFYIFDPNEVFATIDTVNKSLQYGAEYFPKVPGGPPPGSSWINGNYNIIPKGAKHPKAAFEFSAWLAGYDNVPYVAKWMTKGWIPVAPALYKSPIMQKWIARNKWVKIFYTALNDPNNTVTTATPVEAVYYNATSAAVQDVETKKMTAMQALQYIDKQANDALKKSRG